jgi:hypothetical protein
MKITKKEHTGINRETLQFFRDEGAIGIRGITPLALPINTKVRTGKRLSRLEQGILDLGLTREQVQFVADNLPSLCRAIRPIGRGRSIHKRLAANTPCL